MTEHPDSGPTSARRALSGAGVPAALAALLACALTLGGLVAWTASGRAGKGQEIEVSDARIYLPANPDTTAAFFTVRNTGDTADELIGVRSSAVGFSMLSESVEKGNAQTMRMVLSVPLAARSTLRMSHSTVDVMIRPAPRLKPGDRVPFTLQFRDNPPIEVEAVAVRPGI
ncbi:copper chaperone PCu(A)C [Streptomyces sp. NPDC048639]|uniref:copper chaperone PCu(A)C n=1 Tax=Streptomyces sp. NPDC048639 TaxID=3365581 RepID=UPI0037167611